jgi:hypothetical protein
MDLFIPESMTLIGWWSREHSPVFAQSRDGETSGTSIHLEGDAQRATLVDDRSEPIEWRMRSTNRTIRRNRGFGSGSGGGVVVIWNGIPGADAQIDLLDGCNEAI